jgi:hypothetical protein
VLVTAVRLLGLDKPLGGADRMDLEARELRPGRFAFATAGSLSYVARGATWQVRKHGLERAEETAYQDGVWLGRSCPWTRSRRARRRRRGTKWSGL